MDESPETEGSLAYSLGHRELILALLDVLQARTVVEVGAATGSFTAELLRWADRTGAAITAIDNAPTPELRALAEARPELKLVEAMSIDALPVVERSDAYVIDGDHNYFTVSEELRLIALRGHQEWTFPLVLLHDVWWPWGRRDCYYDEQNIAPELRQPTMPAEDFGAWGRATFVGSGIRVATHEGGPKNGVLTAVEDFVASRESLRLVVIPAFHGLGVLYPIDAPWAAWVQELIGVWDRNPLIVRLEEDRIEKIQSLAELVLKHRAIWEEGVAHAHELEAGWRQSADQVLNLERQLGYANQDVQSLQKGWQEATRNAETAQRTLNAYEEALFRNTRDWLESLRGPTLTAVPRFAIPDPSRYQAWIANHVAPAPPQKGPFFSIVTPIFNPQSRFLEACIRSVRAQGYGTWQHVLVNASTEPHVAPICRRFSLIEERVTVVTAENRGIAGNTALGVDHARGEWLVFLDHDDELAPHALAALAQVIADDADADFIYSDEDKLDDRGERVDPFFKPDWSPDLLGTVNYIGHLVAVRRSLYDAAGGLRDGFDGAQDYDFHLRATPVARKIVHIPDVLYHWRRHENSTAGDVRVKPEAHGAGRRALQAYADRWSPGAWVDLGAGPTTHRLRYPLQYELISIIIPFRDRPEVTEQCLQSMARCCNELPFEALLVSNRSRRDKTYELMEQWERLYPWARCLEYDEPFNFQALNNWSVQRAEGTLLLFLNNDTEVLHDKWLDGLAEHAQRPEIGAVGPRLLYPDGLVQHAGIAVGLGGFADHPWAGLHPDAWTPAGPSWWVRNFLAVTAACLMIERSKFDAVGGFDERFTVCGGDVDLGLRLYAAGYRNVMTPFVRLVHHECVTRDRVPPDEDVLESLRAYAPYLAGHDPYYNVNLTLEDTSCDVRRTTESVSREGLRPPV